eukprot:g8918.t1
MLHRRSSTTASSKVMSGLVNFTASNITTKSREIRTFICSRKQKLTASELHTLRSALMRRRPRREFESEAEALDRLQDGFKNPPKVDEKEAEENANVQIGDEEIAEEHKKEQGRQAIQRAGLFKTEDSEIKTGSIPMDKEESSSKPMVTEEVQGDLLDHKYSRLEPTGKLWFYGQDTGGIKWRQGSFYEA